MASVAGSQPSLQSQGKWGKGNHRTVTPRPPALHCSTALPVRHETTAAAPLVSTRPRWHYPTVHLTTTLESRVQTPGLRALLRSHPQISFSYESRSTNNVADSLAKHARIEETGFLQRKILYYPPPVCIKFLFWDAVPPPPNEFNVDCTNNLTPDPG